MINRMGFTGRAALLSSAAMIAFGMSVPARAQAQQQPAPQSQNAKDAENETIVITAQRRPEAILKIPQSVTVVGGKELERQHSVTFSDYLSQIPGLSLEQSQPGQGRLVLRGVNTGGVSSTVAVYVDETPFGSSTGLVNGAILAGDFDTFDVARLEVLRGPQGTLYGASSLGGVLKFVTNAPELGEFSGRARGGLEFVDGGGTGSNVSGVVNVPIGAIAALRVSGFYRKNAGWIDASGQSATLINPLAGALPTTPPFPPEAPPIQISSLGGKNINKGQEWGGRASLLVKPTSDLTVRLTAITQHIESDAPSLAEVDENFHPIRDNLDQTRFFHEPHQVKYRLYNGLVDYDFGFANLTSSTSYGSSEESFTLDAVPILANGLTFILGPFNPNRLAFPILGAPFPPEPLTFDPIGPFENQQTDVHKFTQEFRLASPSNQKFEWMLGAYYTKETGKIDQAIGSIDLATGQPFGIPALDDLATARIDSKYRELAGFANVTYHLTDRFDITAGGRFANNKQSAHQRTDGTPPVVSFSDFTTKSHESVFTYSLSPRLQISNTTAVYARVAKGFRPGGPNVVSPTSPPDVPRTFDSDTITSYEVGLKTNVGRRLSFDIAAYHLNWKDIQLLTAIDNVGVNINGGTAASNGIEGSLTLRPLRGLQLGVNGAWIDAHLTSDTPALVGGLDGDRLPWVPKFSGSLNADYDWQLSHSVTAFVGGTLAYTGTQRDNFGADTTQLGFPPIPQRKIPDYATVDLHGGVDFGRFTVEAYVKNLTNSDGISSLTTGITDQVVHNNILPGGAIRAAFIRPRTIGFTVSASF
jgi:outer membrane receptor protein involved in Fe transport